MIFEVLCNSLSINGFEDSLAVCFGYTKESEEELVSYIMLQYSLEDTSICPKESLYLEVNDQSSSMRGGIKKLTLNKSSLILELIKETAHLLELDETPSTILIQFDFDDGQLEELAYAFSEVIFKNHDIFINNL
jgi:hypothetical protein